MPRRDIVTNLGPTKVLCKATSLRAEFAKCVLTRNISQLLHADFDETRHAGGVSKNITHTFSLAPEIHVFGVKLSVRVGVWRTI